VIVEGHTDNVPINNDQFTDNWDLSVNRATEVVRVLQHDYLVDPTRLTAAGKSEYHPKSENDTTIGRSRNRRTEIVIQPRMDQFFNLLEMKNIQG
jgi:chemotaxis protein MotB